jgi:AraC-like DNA-binding protein
MNLPLTLKELSQQYNLSSKFLSKQFKNLAYTENGEHPPKRLRILSPRRVKIFMDKFGTPY